MVSPERKRQAVLHVQCELEVSERRACTTIRQPRATQRYRGRKRDQDAALVAELRRLSAAHPRAGYRMATALLRRAGMEINAKRVQRLWRLEGLKVPRRQRKRQRLGNSENGTQRKRATRVNEVWSYDFVFDQTEDGRRLKWLPICDEFSRENVALEVERRMESADVIRILDAAVAARLALCQPPLFPSASSAGARRSSSAATTDPSSSRWRCRNGWSGAGSRPSTSPLAVRGRTPTAKASTAGFGTSS